MQREKTDANTYNTLVNQTVWVVEECGHTAKLLGIIIASGAKRTAEETLARLVSRSVWIRVWSAGLGFEGSCALRRYSELSQDAQGTLQSRRCFRDLYEREEPLTICCARICTAELVIPRVSTFFRTRGWLVSTQLPLWGWLIADAHCSVKCCITYYILGAICLLHIPSLADTLF